MPKAARTHHRSNKLQELQELQAKQAKQAKDNVELVQLQKRIKALERDAARSQRRALKASELHARARASGATARARSSLALLHAALRHAKFVRLSLARVCMRVSAQERELSAAYIADGKWIDHWLDAATSSAALKADPYGAVALRTQYVAQSLQSRAYSTYAERVNPVWNKMMSTDDELREFDILIKAAQDEEDEAAKAVPTSTPSARPSARALVLAAAARKLDKATAAVEASKSLQRGFASVGTKGPDDEAEFAAASLLPSMLVDEAVVNPAIGTMHFAFLDGVRRMELPWMH